MLDVLDDVDAIDGMDELRKEFNESTKDLEEFSEHKVNIK